MNNLNSDRCVREVLLFSEGRFARLSQARSADIDIISRAMTLIMPVISGSSEIMTASQSSEVLAFLTMSGKLAAFGDKSPDMMDYLL